MTMYELRFPFLGAIVCIDIFYENMFLDIF